MEQTRRGDADDERKEGCGEAGEEVRVRVEERVREEGGVRARRVGERTADYWAGRFVSDVADKLKNTHPTMAPRGQKRP